MGGKIKGYKDQTLASIGLYIEADQRRKESKCLGYSMKEGKSKVKVKERERVRKGKDTRGFSSLQGSMTFR